MISYNVSDRIRTLPLGDIRFGGEIGEQTETFLGARIFGDYARTVVYPETEKQFRIRDDDITVVGVWRGEFWGKWIISACRAARYEHSDEMKEFIRRGCYALIETADEDGYIGTYRDKEYVLPCDPEKAKAAVGWRSNWNWNLWCRKYTLWGLLEAYQLTGDETILAAAKKAASQQIDMLARLGLKINDCGTFVGMPACSIMKPMLILYRITGDETYLNFCLDVAAEWDRPDGKCPNLIVNAFSGRPVHEWSAAGGRGWAKAYEMMSCLDGLLELYRITGTARILDAMKNIWELLWTHEQNALFSVGFNDQFTHGAAYPNALTEPCDVLHWMRFTSELYKLTGDVKYMHVFERTFYNPFLASAFKDGSWGARCARTAGRHMVAHLQANMQHSHCCVNNMPRGFLNAAESFVMEDADGLVINLYSAFTARSAFADVKISGSYLRDGRATVEIDAKRDFTLRLRLPDWSAHTTLDGKEITAADGYHRLPVKAGKTVLSLTFDMALVLREMAEAQPRPDSKDYRIARYVSGNPVTEDVMTWDRRATLLYGPLLLTRSKLCGNTEAEMFEGETVAHKGYALSIAPAECEGVNFAFDVIFTNADGARTIRMCDYASGTNLESVEDDRLFNVYI